MMATSGDVLRKVEAMWRDPGEQARVQQELERYGQEGHERERERVQLAILKLCESRVDKVAELVELAKQDYRDVLVWAEYPEEGRALWACQPHLSEAEQRKRCQAPFGNGARHLRCICWGENDGDFRRCPPQG